MNVHADFCAHCAKNEIYKTSIADGESPLCQDCYQDEIRALLTDLDPNEQELLRCRLEKLFRQNPGTLIDVAASLAAREKIQFEDLV